MNQKFYEKDWFLWVCLIFIAPVGIFLLWKNGKFNKKIRIALTAVFCIWFIVALATGGKTKTPQDTTTANKPEVKQTETTEKKETPKKEWKPKELAELGKPYYCYDKSKTTYDGLTLALNVSEVQKKDDSIVAISHAPGYDDLKYAREKYMAISLFECIGNYRIFEG